MFENIQVAPADPILGLNDAYRNDPNPNKINLGVGVYKDELGATPILKSVKQAEERLVATEKTKSYLSIEGTEAYRQAVQELLFGAGHDVIAKQRARTAQSPGGTGALRIAAEFIKKTPTWCNRLGK